jgi:hypothetical protein
MVQKFDLKKFQKGCKKAQAASGRGWTTSFPHDRLKHDKASESKVVKVKSQPTKFYMTADELIAAAEKEADAKSASSKLVASTKSTTIKPATVKPAAVKPAAVKLATTKPATVKLATARLATTKPAMVKSATVKLAATKPARESREDSLSPLPTAPRVEALMREDSGISLKSSSSATSAKGVHLHLATVPAATLGSWTAGWIEYCRRSAEHIDAYYSTIETTVSSTDLIVYADCDNKLMANLLRGKLAGDKVLGKMLICQII